MSKKVLIVLQTREISERRDQCLSITWYGWKCAHGSQLQSYDTRHVFTVNNTKVTEFTYYEHHLFMINFVLSTFTRYLIFTTLYAMENESEKKEANTNVVLFKTQVQGDRTPFFWQFFFSFGVFCIRVRLITLTYYPLQFSIHIIFGYYIDSNQILCG